MSIYTDNITVLKSFNFFECFFCCFYFYFFEVRLVYNVVYDMGEDHTPSDVVTVPHRLEKTIFKTIFTLYNGGFFFFFLITNTDLLVNGHEVVMFSSLT